MRFSEFQSPLVGERSLTRCPPSRLGGRNEVSIPSYRGTFFNAVPLGAGRRPFQVSIPSYRGTFFNLKMPQLCWAILEFQSPLIGERSSTYHWGEIQPRADRVSIPSYRGTFFNLKAKATITAEAFEFQSPLIGERSSTRVYLRFPHNNQEFQSPLIGERSSTGYTYLNPAAVTVSIPSYRGTFFNFSLPW